MDKRYNLMYSAFLRRKHHQEHTLLEHVMNACQIQQCCSNPQLRIQLKKLWDRPINYRFQSSVRFFVCLERIQRF